MAAQSATAASPEAGAALTKAVVRAAQRLGLSQRELASVIGVSAATVSRMRTGRYQLSPQDKSWELAALLVRLFRSLDSLTGGDEAAAAAWLHSENGHLHAMPAELIGQVQGLVDTLAYVDSFRARV